MCWDGDVGARRELVPMGFMERGSEGADVREVK